MDQGNDTAGRFEHLRGALRDYPPLIWSFLYFFFLLTGYYVMRPVRDAVAASNDPAMVFPPAMVQWFAGRGVDLGEFQIQALFTGTFLSMLLLQPVYGALVSRFPRRVFLPAVYLVFIACLFGFYFAFDLGMPGRGGAYFIWVAVFNLFAVSVFWSFMADIYTDPEARRLYGFIAAGGTIGGFSGPVITRTLVNEIGVANLLRSLNRLDAGTGGDAAGRGTAASTARTGLAHGRRPADADRAHGRRVARAGEASGDHPSGRRRAGVVQGSGDWLSDAYQSATASLHAGSAEPSEMSKSHALSAGRACARTSMIGNEALEAESFWLRSRLRRPAGSVQK